MADKIVFNKATENLIEISRVFSRENERYDLLEDIENRTWYEKFVEWANEFEERHGASDWNSGECGDYYEAIEEYAKTKILNFMEEQSWRIRK